MKEEVLMARTYLFADQNDLIEKKIEYWVVINRRLKSLCR